MGDRKYLRLKSSRSLWRIASIVLYTLTFTALIGLRAASAATIADVSPTAVATTGSSWNNPTYVFASDNQRATGKSNSQDQLRITGFDFSGLPNGAQIDGITVKVEGQHSSGSADYRQFRLNLTKNGTSAAGTWKTDIQWAQNTDTIVTRGSASDLWGAAWNTNDIKGNADFGILFSDTDTSRTSTNPGWGVDHITVTIDYTATCTDADPSTITIPAGQTAAGDPFDAGAMLSATGDVAGFEYKVTSGGGIVELLDNGGAGWGTHTEHDPAPTSHSYTAPAGDDRVVVVVISGEGANPTISGVTIGGSTATLIDTETNGDSTIWAYYRPIGSSAAATTANIAVNWNNDPNTDAAINAATYSGVVQDVGTGVGFAINSVATGSAASGTTTSSSSVTNVEGGRAIYAVNLNRGDGNNQIDTATSSAWTFTETWDVYVTSNRTAAGHSDTAAGTATVSVGPSDSGTDSHNRSTMVVFALNPASAATICTDWTSTPDIPASTGMGSSCDFTDGGVYTLEVRGTDPDCGDSVTATATDFSWSACTDPDPSTITIPGSQTVSGDPFDASGMFSSTGDVGSFEYRISSGSGSVNVELLDNSGASWNTHTEGDPAPTSHSYTAPIGDDRVVVAVISGEGSSPTITSVTIGGSAATLIDTITNGDSTIWAYYRPIGSSASTTSANIAVNWNNDPNTDAAINAATYSGVIQDVGTGTGFAINSVATGSAASGTTTTSSSITNVEGGRVIYGVNLNRGDGNNQIDTATSSAWTFTETWDVYVTSNRTATGDGGTAAGTATVSVGPSNSGTDNHNRSTMVVFALNPSSSTTACTDWTSTADIPASIANGSACDYVDGGTYTLDVRGTDPDCSDAVTTTATDFTWNAAYTPIASFRMEQASWDGTVGEVIDSMGNYHGTARGNSNLPMTTNADPAIGGDPGTCTYGEFDDSDDYIEIPGFPDLTSDFTVTAWIRTRTNTSAGQRIFADDENNAGGYALSLGDPGAGRLRFYSRAASPVSMDTGNIIANDTWYFVAGVADIVNKTRTIYIYDTSFTQLASVTGSYTGSWGTDTGMASIGGETNSGETANRFDGNLDEVRIYTSAIPQAGIEQIMRETHSCPVLATVDHYEIHHDGVALTCQPEDVIVYACENADCSSQYAGSTNVTMSPAGWVGGDSKSFTDNDTFQLRHTTAEAVTLGISSSNPNADVSCYQGGAPASCTLTFYDAGFLFDVPTQTACRISSALTISAVRLDVTSQQCIPAFANRTENINFWSTYEDPATGTENISVSGTPVATSSPGTAVPLTFNASGESTFTVQYDDAGELRLDAGFTGSGAEAGLMMAGNDSFVAAPAGLCVYADEATADCGSGDGTCTAFTRAGQDFNLKVKGVCWETSGEADADFCDNPTTPNFQLSSIALSHSLVAPGTGVSGSIGVSGFDMIAGDNGEHTISNQTVNEVGVFTFTADPPDYLGAGDIIPASTSANIGRFIPDHFSVSINPDPPTLANSCLAGAFTYLGKNFTYAGNPQITITAQNTANTTTHNYEGGFWKLGEPFILNYTYADSAAPVALSPAGSSASSAAGDTADCNGTLTVTLTDSFSYARPAATSPVAPFAGSVDLSVAPAEFTDTDTVCSDSGSGCQGLTRNAITGISLRHGRIKVKDNFGPKNEDISPSPFQIQFWDDFDADAVYEWETNTDENAATCTTEPTLGFCTDNAGHSIAIDAGSLLAGAGTVTVGHDVLETARTVRVCPTTPAELTSLTGCGSANDKCGNLTFGIYRGNDRIINWLEILR